MKVGDLALVTGSKFYPELVGQAVVIVGPYQLRLARMPDGSVREMLRYQVQHKDGSTGLMSYRNLMPLQGDESVTERVTVSEDGNP